jgi:cation transport ATPase
VLILVQDLNITIINAATDITLISGSLAGVVTAIRLSRATMRNIRQTRPTSHAR